jgi:phage tail-like protein
VSPLANYKFRIQLRINGKDVAEFSECSGLEMSVKVDEVREGGQNEFVYRLPGRIEYGNLTLRRGYVTNSELFTWIQSVFNRRQIARESVTVEILDQARQPMGTWVFRQAYPVKWSGPSLKAGENAIAIESIELAHEGLEL